jgi:hypothetical protein
VQKEVRDNTIEIVGAGFKPALSLKKGIRNRQKKTAWVFQEMIVRINNINFWKPLCLPFWILAAEF